MQWYRHVNGYWLDNFVVQWHPTLCKYRVIIIDILLVTVHFDLLELDVSASL